MKNLLLTLFVVTLFLSCEKEGGNETPTPVQTPPPVVPAFKFSCTINGAHWGSDSTFNEFLLETSAGFKVLTCIGFDSIRSVSVSWIGQGTGNLSVAMDTSITPTPAMILYEGYKNGVYLDDYFPISGKLHFTAYDSIAQTVSGTFESVQVEQNVNDTVIITNGKFTGLHFDLIVI